MARELRQKSRIGVYALFLKNFAVTIAHDPLQSLIQCALMLHLAVPINKHEV